MNEQKIEKGHYLFEHRQNRSTIIVFFGTAHKLKFSEIELLLRVFDHLPPPGFGGHVSKKGRRNKPRKDDVFDAFRVCGIFGHAKYTIILDGFCVFSRAPPRVKRKFIKIRLARARVLKKGPRIRARVRILRFLKFVFGDSQVFEEVPSVLTKSGAGRAYFTHLYDVF